MAEERINCPSFDHPDENASAVINTETQKWICLACGRGGALGTNPRPARLEVIVHAFVTPDDDDLEDHGEVYLDHQLIAQMGKYGKVDVKHIEVIEHPQ